MVARIDFKVLLSFHNSPTTMVRVRPDQRTVPDSFIPFDVDFNHPVFQAFYGPPSASPVVQEMGEHLLKKLNLHPHFQPALNAVTVAPHGAPREVRLFFDPAEPVARNCPWEVLVYGGASFLMLDNGVPIVREVKAGVGAQDTLVPQGDVLRLLVVIAAVRVNGKGEWSAVRAALDGLPAGSKISVLVLTSDRGLEQTINAAGLQDVKAELVPYSLTDFIARVENFNPHVAHFFAHGIADTPAALEVERSAGGGSAALLLTVSELQAALAPDALLVVLNSCELGAPTSLARGGSSTSSFAEGLVEQGVPIVVGMRGEVQASEAHNFARGFHSHALPILLAALKNGSRDIRLGAAFKEGCRSILTTRHVNNHQMAKCCDRAWALPSMFVSSSQLNVAVLRPPPGPSRSRETDPIQREKLIGEATELRKLLELLSEELDEEGKRGIRARLLQIASALAI